jgi:hypothetical protein
MAVDRNCLIVQWPLPKGTEILRSFYRPIPECHKLPIRFGGTLAADQDDLISGVPPEAFEQRMV